MATGTQVDVVMPQMGVSVSEGTITKWLKQPGEAVAQDEPLLEISTDKVDTEVPSPGAGVVQEILVQEGETVEVGTRLAVIAPEGSAPAEPAPEARGSAASSPRRRRTTRRPSRARAPSQPRLRRRRPRPRRRRSRRATASSCPRSSRASRPSTASTRAGCRAPAPAAA